MRQPRTELCQAGVLVKERYSQQNPEEVTGYAVALPQHQPAGEPTWQSGGKLADHLSLPRLQARWSGQEAAPTGSGRTSRLSPEERQAVWDEATRAATTAAAEIRHLVGTDPGGAGDVARAAADLLRAAARVAEPSEHGPLNTAAASYDRASRDLYGRTPPAGRNVGAGDLRLAALALTLLRRAGPGDTTAVAALIAAAAGLAEAVAELRTAQQRHHQAAAASAAAGPLRAAQPATTAPPAAERARGIRQGPEPPARRRRL